MTETLTTAIGSYRHTEPLTDGRISSTLLRLDFVAIAPINRAFAPMVRELRFDVSELAIGTFLQARACEKPIVLLPVVLARRFQEAALLCRADSDLRPDTLAGKRIGVRAYSQTTALWLRGVLQDSFDVCPQQVRWITFEDAHVAEMADPPFAERAAPGADLLEMLKAGTLDAAILGNDLPADPALRTVFPDPVAAGEAFRSRYGLMPINHMLVVKRSLAEQRPELLGELVRLFEASAAIAGAAVPDRDMVERGVALALRLATAQAMLARPLTTAEVWDRLPGS